MSGCDARRAPLGLFLFLFSMGMLEALDAEEISQKVKSFWLPVLLVNWQVSRRPRSATIFFLIATRLTEPLPCARLLDLQVWPLLQLINFRFVPLRSAEHSPHSQHQGRGQSLTVFLLLFRSASVCRSRR